MLMKRIHSFSIFEAAPGLCAIMMRGCSCPINHYFTDETASTSLCLAIMVSALFSFLPKSKMKEAIDKQLANEDYQRFLKKVPRVEGVWDDHDYGGMLFRRMSMLAYVSFPSYLQRNAAGLFCSPLPSSATP